MKQIYLILVCLALFTACNKNQVVPVTVTVISSNVIDTFTLTDNGITYIDTNLNITLDEMISGDLLTIIAQTTAQFPIAFELFNVTGPGSNIGLYQLYPQDTLASSNLFAETYSGGVGYTIDSAAINITAASSSLVAGTYQLWVSNIEGRKTVAGTIKCHHPVIE